ncbi:hypothetical protein Toil_gp32 [Rhodococcus phage Toil]|uniref:Uncharacterized protein n=1 Tax=Rhodococcus phage Toil TaxID=1975614 RepID=A0A1W6DXU5_9VIRU|nr:hypothetical protein KMD62_gp32 [Rhodococcus phage Toil]ARK07715.1 hypothetical protein Toil_gp32 [Rhodococcus phage Toil]
MGTHLRSVASTGAHTVRRWLPTRIPRRAESRVIDTGRDRQTMSWHPIETAWHPCSPLFAHPRESPGFTWKPYP